MRGQKTAQVFGLGCCMALITGCTEQVAAPTKFADYAAKDGAFSCIYPADWTKEEGARADNSYSWVKFTKGSAQIKISADAGGSVLGDIEKAGPGNADEKEENTVARVHETQERSTAEEYTSYREKTPRPVKNTSLGPGAQSDFTADGGFGIRLRGTRTTFLANNRRISILCQSPLPNWRVLKPAFDKVIDSVHSGGGK
ncbi:MAG TPA: hypothetical protein VGY53_07870 [Isosphaeraceae bacterium]|nr:hypothetical protein [Isosphaeraceae bacterium]